MRRALLQTSLLALVLGSSVACKMSQQAKMFKHRPVNYSAVVSLSPSTSEVLLSTINYNKLVGRTQYDNYPEYSTKRVTVVADVKPNYEKLAGLHPDLIVYDPALYNDQDIAKLKTLGAAMYAFGPDTLADYRNDIFDLSGMLGGEAQASTYLDKVQAEVSAAESKPPQPTPKVAVVMPSESGDDMICGTDSFLADVVKHAGGKPVGPAGKLFVKLTPEMLVSQNPDFIICNGSKKDVKAAVALANDPRFQTVAAIKNKHIRVIDSDILLRRGARVDQLVHGIYVALSGVTTK